MQKLFIRQMRVEDIDEVYEIEIVSYPSPWHKQTFYNELTMNYNAYYLVIVLNNKIIGYGGIHILLDEAHLTTLTIHPQYRRKGIGKILLIELIQESIKRNTKFMTLEVRVSNKAAQELYKKFKFRKVGIRKRYYMETKEDAYIFSSPEFKNKEFIEWFNEFKQIVIKDCDWEIIKEINLIA